MIEEESAETLGCRRVLVVIGTLCRRQNRVRAIRDSRGHSPSASASASSKRNIDQRICIAMMRRCVAKYQKQAFLHFLTAKMKPTIVALFFFIAVAMAAMEVKASDVERIQEFERKVAEFKRKRREYERKVAEFKRIQEYERNEIQRREEFEREEFDRQHEEMILNYQQKDLQDVLRKEDYEQRKEDYEQSRKQREKDFERRELQLRRDFERRLVEDERRLEEEDERRQEYERRQEEDERREVRRLEYELRRQEEDERREVRIQEDEQIRIHESKRADQVRECSGHNIFGAQEVQQQGTECSGHNIFGAQEVQQQGTGCIWTAAGLSSLFVLGIAAAALLFWSLEKRRTNGRKEVSSLDSNRLRGASIK